MAVGGGGDPAMAEVRGGGGDGARSVKLNTLFRNCWLNVEIFLFSGAFFILPPYRSYSLAVRVVGRYVT